MTGRHWRKGPQRKVRGIILMMLREEMHLHDGLARIGVLWDDEIPTGPALPSALDSEWARGYNAGWADASGTPRIDRMRLADQ